MHQVATKPTKNPFLAARLHHFPVAAAILESPGPLPYGTASSGHVHTMSNHRDLADYLASLRPRLVPHDGGAESPAELLDETVEELLVAVEELRVAEEEIASVAEAAEQDRRSTLRFRDVFDAAPAALLLTDGAGVVVRANAMAARLLGTAAPDLRGKPLAVYVDDASRRPFRRLLLQMTRADRRGTLALRLRPRGGHPLEAELAAWTVPGDDGLLGWLVQEVTPGHAPAADEDELAVLRRTLDALPDAVAAMDLDGSVLAWNRAARALLGWSEDEVVGGPNPALPDELMPVVDAVRAAGSDPALNLTVTTVAERKDGLRVRVDLALSALGGPDGVARGTVAVIRPTRAAAGAEAADEAQPRPRWPAAELRRVLFGGAAGGDVAARLRTGIAAALDLGYLRPGDRLPGTREAAAVSGIDHRVISSAYRRLASEGLVEVRPRRGPVVAAPPAAEVEPQGETQEWLAGVLVGAAELQVRVPALADLVRRWTASVPVRCLCVDATEDGRAALVQEMTAQWGMECTAISPDHRGGQRELGAAIREADLVVTTHHAAGAVRSLARAAGRAVVVAAARADLVEALEEALLRGPLTAVVVDPAFAERLRAAPEGERLRVVLAGDEAAVQALPADEAVLLTLAAQHRIKRPLRLLAPPAHFVAPLDARALARVLIRANLAPPRRG
jgi:PAS domain S-box-containing protein